MSAITFANTAPSKVEMTVGSITRQLPKNAEIHEIGPDNKVEIKLPSGSSFVFDWQDVTSPVVASRPELVLVLATDFFTGDSVVVDAPVGGLPVEIQKNGLPNSEANPVDTLSQIEGRTKGGNNVRIGANSAGALLVDIARDIFGRLSVGLPETLWNGTSIFGYLTDLYWTNFIDAGPTPGSPPTITHNKATSSYTLSIGIGQKCGRQLKTRIGYQPSKAHEFLVTGTYVPQTGVVKRVGLGDMDNYDEPTVDGTIYNGVVMSIYGTGEGPNGATATLKIMNNGVPSSTEVGQADWNIDKLDGTGPSLITLDLTKAEISVGELEWLGVGAVRLSLNIGGVNVPVHMFEHANVSIENVYMRTANLSPFYLVESYGGAGTMTAICNAVNSGGGHNPIGAPNVVELPAPILIEAGQEEGLIFIRLKPEAYEANVDITKISGVASTGATIILRLLYNPTWAGTPVWQDVPNSHLQVAYATSNTSNFYITNRGRVMETVRAASQASGGGQVVRSKLKLGKSLQSNVNQTGRYDVIVLSAQSLENSGETFTADISYIDIG